MNEVASLIQSPRKISKPLIFMTLLFEVFRSVDSEHDFSISRDEDVTVKLNLQSCGWKHRGVVISS